MLIFTCGFVWVMCMGARLRLAAWDVAAVVLDGLPTRPSPSPPSLLEQCAVATECACSPGMSGDCPQGSHMQLEPTVLEAASLFHPTHFQCGW